MSDEALGADLLRRAGAGCCGPDRGLLALLREDAPIYAGRGAIEAERLRAFVMECVSRAGLASDALAFIREDLEVAIDPFAIAAAARAARSLTLPPADIEALLRGAADRVRVADEAVCLEAYPAPVGAGGRTAIEEIEATLAAIRGIGRGEGAGCAPETAPRDALLRLRDVALQDQDGVLTTFGRLLLGRPCVIAFFYTRCMNPEKCSRTIARLGALAGLIEGADAVVAGITYDPAYDLPHRLRHYGEARGFPFAPHARLLRPTGSFAPLREALSLGVGYGETTVNRHAVELFVADAEGRLIECRARRLWDEREVASVVWQASMDQTLSDGEPHAPVSSRAARSTIGIGSLDGVQAVEPLS